PVQRRHAEVEHFCADSSRMGDLGRHYLRRPHATACLRVPNGICPREAGDLRRHDDLHAGGPVHRRLDYDSSLWHRADALLLRRAHPQGRLRRGVVDPAFHAGSDRAAGAIAASGRIRGPGVRAVRRTLLAVFALLLSASVVAAVDTPPVERCDLAGYQQHMQQLGAIVRTCSAQKSSAACDPAQVGPDNEVTAPRGTRLVHYGWLRQALADAAKSAALANKQGDAARGEIAAAALRLTQDSQSSPSEAAAPPISRVRGNLNSILSEQRFQRIQQEPSVLQRAWASLLNWIFERLNKVVAYGGENPWIAYLVEGVAIC